MAVSRLDHRRAYLFVASPADQITAKLDSAGAQGPVVCHAGAQPSRARHLDPSSDQVPTKFRRWCEAPVYSGPTADSAIRRRLSSISSTHT